MVVKGRGGVGGSAASITNSLWKYFTERLFLFTSVLREFFFYTFAVLIIKLSINNIIFLFRKNESTFFPVHNRLIQQTSA